MKNKLSPLNLTKKISTALKSKLISSSKLSSTGKANSFFHSLLRGGKLPPTAVSVSDIKESFAGQLKKISLNLNFNKLGSKELSDLIKGIQRKPGARIIELNIRSDQSSRLALGTMKMEIVTK